MTAVDLARPEPVLAGDARVRFGYVSGSVAAGTDRPGSDVDLAVSVHPRGTLLDDARLHDALAAALGREDVDLVELADTPLAEFTADPRNHGSAERFLQLAIETTSSIGHHVIAEDGFAQPGSDAEVFVVLGREGVIDPAFAIEIAPMARMRNRLVHHHEEVSADRVHETLAARLGDFDRFAAQVTRYADRY